MKMGRKKRPRRRRKGKEGDREGNEGSVWGGDYFEIFRCKCLMGG
jgi:hypothetical protein